jgi:hypothetical protein
MAPAMEPLVKFTKSLVSSDDNYIKVELSDVIRSFLISPSNNGQEYPIFKYGGLNGTNQSEGEGTFYQVTYQANYYNTVTDKYITGPLVTMPTMFATLGYRWNYEGILANNNGDSPGGSLGYVDTVNPETGELDKYYDKWIPNYFSTKFDYSPSLEGVTSENLLVRTPIKPSKKNSFCTRDPYLLIYLNKLGLWETFTPFGKVVVTDKIESDTSGRLYRNRLNIGSNIYHGKARTNVDVTQTYTMNTGYLKESMTQLVEELIYSPKVYLIKFNGDTFVLDSTLFTVDSTLLTVDSTVITDDQTWTGEKITHFLSYQQIPVVLKDNDFVRKTRTNEKTSINYSLTWEETRNKINDVR